MALERGNRCRITQKGEGGNPRSDTVGHGSLVAGVAAGRSADGRFVGIAPGATIYSLNVNGPSGPRSSNVIAALGWVFANAHKYNIRVINLSLGETVQSSYHQSVLDLAVERLWAAGVVVVAAAGNKGSGQIDFAPANDPLVLTVGSTDTRGTATRWDDVLAPFTSRGQTVDGFPKPEVLAPGRLVASVLPRGTALARKAPARNRVATGYAAISGTSFSAPQASGAVALILQRHPAWELVASTWSSGAWNGSSWKSGAWSLATWNAGTWNSGNWSSGTWSSGAWNSGTWSSGTWNSGKWNASTWK